MYLDNMTGTYPIVTKMAIIAALCWISFTFSITGSDAATKFNVLYTPDSLKFLRSNATLESLLKEILCACLGLSVNENTVWKGLYVTDPFNTPEAVVEVCLEGVSNLDSFMNNQTFPLIIDKDEPDIFEGVKLRINQRYTTGGNKLLDIKLYDPKELTSQNFINIFGEIKVPNVTEQSFASLKHLKINVKEDLLFLTELETLKAITAKVLSGGIVPDNIVDFYNFRFGSLRALIDRHGPKSVEAKEAEALLSKALQELSNTFIKAYDGSVLVSTIVSDVTPTRRAVRSPEYNTNISEYESGPAKIIRRQEGEVSGEGVGEAGGEGGIEGISEGVGEGVTEGLGEVGGDIGLDGGGLAPIDYINSRNQNSEDEDFAIVFNIILWFGLVYIFTILAIVYATMDMDPGRDTVIYRMTTPRVKKEL